MSDDKKFPRTNPNILLGRLRKQFPDVQWTSYTSINDGWDHEVLILDNKLVFRFPNDEVYLALLRNEIELLKYLQPLAQINIPNYTFVAPDYSFAGYPIVPGTQLSVEVFQSLKPVDRTLIAKQLAAFLSMMHALRPADLSFDLSSHMEDDQAKSKDLAKKYLGGKLSQQDYATTQEILNQIDELLAQKLPRVFLHGDLYSSHLFWNAPTKQLGLIDFSDMSLGDPAIDFCELYEYGADFVQEVYGYYTGLKDDTLLQRAWKYQCWVGVYMMVDHFMYHKTSFEVARKTFDRIKNAV